MDESSMNDIPGDGEWGDPFMEYDDGDLGEDPHMSKAMTRKEELEARARDYVSLFVMNGTEPAATNRLVWMLEQVEWEVLERVDRCIDEADHMGDVRNSIYSQQQELSRRRTTAEQQAQQIAMLRDVLKELHALVQGECPRLLNEDSGGNAELDLKIEQALKEGTQTST